VKQALRIGEEGQAVATTKQKQHAPQRNKNVPDPYIPGALSTVKRGAGFCRFCLKFPLCLTVAATFGDIIINHAENRVETASLEFR
jgi:hypothetical protein